MLSKSIKAGKYFWNNKETTEEKYSEILAMIRNKPVAPDGYGYRLTEALAWELYELPAENPDPELTAEEAMDIILGGAV